MPVPIISYGAICSAGETVAKGFEKVRHGTDCLRPLRGLQTGLEKPPLCAQLSQTAENDIRNSPAPNRSAALAHEALSQALDGIDFGKSFRTGIVFATTVAGMTRSEQWYRETVNDEAVLSDASSHLAYHEPTAIAGYLAARFGIQGVHTLSTACSTGLHAIGMAKRLVERGTYDICVAVGTDALSILTVRGFAGLLLLDPQGCRPFDAHRAGISLGEGAGAMVLVSEEVLSKTGMQPKAFAAGWGASADSYHMTAPHPQGNGAKMAVAQALADATLDESVVDCIAAHGTGTPDNDSAEIAAMRSIFSSLPPFFSIKRTIGHTLAASGILEAIFSVCALEKGAIPATGGFSTTDESIGAAPASAQEKELRCILKNSFGFGGNNAALLLTRN